MSSESRIIVYVCILILIACACVQGGVTYVLLRGKGYWSNGFWWGFFLGPIGLAVAMLKPYLPQEPVQEKPNMETKPTQSANGQDWKCRCGKQNAYYISSCSCGLSKRDVLMPKGGTAQPAKTNEPKPAAKPVNPSVQTPKPAAQPAAKPVNPSAQTPKPAAQPAAKPVNPSVQPPKSAPVVREAAKKTPPMPAPAQPKDIEERRIAALKEYKAMMDMGIISQEEFEERKKHILSLR